RGVALALEADAPVWLRGEPTLLNELLSNLVDNAIAHSPPGSTVILRVKPDGVLEVEDDGPGIPEAEREQVFKRFYRSRNEGLGAGLGLAIVGEICSAHQARISLQQVLPHGLLVRVEFSQLAPEHGP
ncbi:MAG TPA: histidine kinase, partial [Pseudomonas sp.]|nr:histidine kinase [Pseudomonas sp.]